MRRGLRRLAQAADGVAAVEFALLVPILALLLVAGLQLTLDVWAKTLLTGAVQEAGRDSGLESAHNAQGGIDGYVSEQVHAFLPGAKMTYNRKNYETFSDVGRPEDFTDTNHSGAYDESECFEDENGNGQWDADVGAGGQGGARDVVVYTATVEYDELLPLSRFIGGSATRKFSASTTLMNQPFSTQADRVVKEICP